MKSDLSAFSVRETLLFLHHIVILVNLKSCKSAALSSKPAWSNSRLFIVFRIEFSYDLQNQFKWMFINFSIGKALKKTDNSMDNM